MRKPQLLLLCLLFITRIPSAGQDLYEIDSLVTLLEKEVRDTIRSRLMFEIATELHATDTLLAMNYLKRAEEIANRTNDTRALGRCYQVMGNMNSHHGNYRLALLNYDRSLAYFSEADDRVNYFETLRRKGNVHLFMSDYSQAMNLYTSALEFYRRNQMDVGISRCLNNIGIIYKNRGEYADALAVYEESVTYLDTVADAIDISQSYINMGNIFVFLGSYPRALEYYNRALYIAVKEQHQENISICLLNSGVVQNKCNNYEEALSLYRQALEEGESINDPIQVSNSLINIGTNYADMGQYEDAIEHVQRGMDIKMQLGDERTISNCHIHLAEINFLMEEYDEAIGLFRMAIPVKEQLDDKEGLVRCYLGLASILLTREAYSEARGMTEQAMDIALEINALEHIVRGFETKREIALALGDYRLAYENAMQHDRYSDSLMDEATTKAVMEMEFRNRSRVLEQENEYLHIQSDLNRAIMRKRSAILYSILGIAFLLAVGLILVAYFLRRMRIFTLKLEEKNLVITRQNLELDSLNKTKDRMMSIIAHDLRGTIGNQLTAIEVLHRIDGAESVDIDRKKLLGNLKHSASYSLELLENLLHWSRLKENEADYHPEEVRLATLISDCLALYDETASNKNISFLKKVDENIQCKVDRIMMETIFRNLISNAIKFSNPGGTITILTERDHDSIVFRIEDQGIGMTEEQVNRVTNNGGFTRRGTANEKGSGIGLTLVREFTAIHKGEFSVASKPNEGSSFEVIFPCIN